MNKNLLLLLTFALITFGCKKDNPAGPDTPSLSEDQKRIQGKWFNTHFKRYDYNNGKLDRVVEGDIENNYVEFIGNKYRYYDGAKLQDFGSTFYFDDGELAIRTGNTIFYSTLKWISATEYIETRDDGSSAGGPENKSVFEYTYVKAP